MEKIDIAIAGAGIAGCHAAKELSAAGHSVALVDKKEQTRLGHDWWDAVSIEVFSEVGLPEPAPPELMNSGEEAKVYTPLETQILTVPPRPWLIHIDRKLFARRQLACALEAGARLLDNTAVLGPIVEAGMVAGMMVRRRGGSPEEIRARLVMDASGFTGAVRARIAEPYGFRRRVERRDTFVTYREIRKKMSSSRETLLFFGRDNGVRWINRDQNEYIDFFAGAINLPGRPDPRRSVRELVALAPDAGAAAVRAGCGAPIPVRHCFDSFVAPGLILCGDSACQCNPLDGSGIASSLRAAHIASRTAHAALENNRLDTPALWPYNAAYKRAQGAKFVPLDILQKFMVAETKSNLELLFRRRVVTVADFWGREGAKAPAAIEQILKLLRLLDRPRFMARLVRASAAAKDAAAHYRDYPETYDKNSFESWRKKKTILFRRVAGA